VEKIFMIEAGVPGSGPAPRRVQDTPGARAKPIEAAPPVLPKGFNVMFVPPAGFPEPYAE
jgi:hypothetical protein